MLYLDMQPHSWTCLVARLPTRAQNYLSKSLFVCIGDRAEKRGEGDRRSSIDLDLSTMKRVSISGRSDDDKLGGGGGYEGRGLDGRGRGQCAWARPHLDANWVKWRKLCASLASIKQPYYLSYPSQPRRRVSFLTHEGRVVSGGGGRGGG